MIAVHPGRPSWCHQDQNVLRRFEFITCSRRSGPASPIANSPTAQTSVKDTCSVSSPTIRRCSSSCRTNSRTACRWLSKRWRSPTSPQRPAFRRRRTAPACCRRFGNPWRDSKRTAIRRRLSCCTRMIGRQRNWRLPRSMRSSTCRCRSTRWPDAVGNPDHGHQRADCRCCAHSCSRRGRIEHRFARRADRMVGNVERR